MALQLSSVRKVPISWCQNRIKIG